MSDAGGRRQRTRQLILLAVAVVAFAAMLVLVATGVTRRRNARDLAFGLEELDVLLEDGSTAEAAAMIPWLAERARTAAGAMRVLKRAHALYESEGMVAPLDEAAKLALAEFPANATLRSVAVFAAVRAGRPDDALATVGEGMGADAAALYASLYAWTLLNNPGSRLDAPRPDGRTTDATESELLLAGLERTSPASDFERAWRLTADPRYALDAALLHLHEGATERAVELVTAAGLSQRWPLFAAGLYVDRARYDQAIGILSRLPESSVEARLRLADAFMYAGEESDAREAYDRLLLLRKPPLHALLGRAVLADDGHRRRALIARAGELYPESFAAARAQAVTGAGDGADALARFEATEYEGRARLLELRLETRPDRRGYAARLWTLLSEYPSSDGYRYAAWYFASRGALEDLRLVLERARAAEDQARDDEWWLAYRGVLDAAEGDWASAASRFEESFARSPSWETALNAAVALVRMNEGARAAERMQDALLLARHSREDRRITTFLVAARASREQAEIRRLVEEALAIDPDNPEALLVGAQLEKAPAR
ncbi:MAG: hypothetical protein ACOC6J_06965 [Spirochaetota bacterium]